MENMTAFQRDLLFVIADLGEPYGLRIKRELEEYYGYDVNHGRLYPNLDELVSSGLLTKDARDRRTNEYTVTKRGLRELKARMEWEEKRVDGRELGDLEAGL